MLLHFSLIIFLILVVKSTGLLRTTYRPETLDYTILTILTLLGLVPLNYGNIDGQEKKVVIDTLGNEVTEPLPSLKEPIMTIMTRK